MEKVTYSTKRKKRRTRRCLDEIRNRLQRKCDKHFQHSTQKTKSCILLESKKLENRLVTMDRLTLKAMFPNAVRSETITRSVLEEIKQKQNVHFVDVLKDCATKKAFPLRQEYFCNNMNISASFHNNIPFPECGENSLYHENDYKNNDTVDSPSSLVLFSPDGSINNTVTLSKSVNEGDAVTSSTSSHISQDYRHHRYEELMNEISSYMRHADSSIDKEDAMKKTIHNLQKLYMESCQKECEENIVKSNSSHALTSKKIVIGNQLIIENPLDYIKFEHEQEQNRGFPLDSSDSPSPGGGALTEVPYDTPDYNYYPHRLK